MKNLHKLESLGLFDTHPIKKLSGERLQLLLNGFRVLIQEKVERFTKVALENTKCKKIDLLTISWSLLQFFLQNCIYLRKQPYWTTKSFTVDRIQRFDPRNV